MHEQSLLEALVRQIEGVARHERAAKVLAAHVWVGALSHVMTPDHFREHFDRAAKGTIAEGLDVTLTISDDPLHPDSNGLQLERIEVES
jgi:hydrogenase nickel incorporation protein HypA/HybF